MKNNATLIDRLEQIVDAVHIDEVKEIISTLSKISSFKHIIEDDLTKEAIYRKTTYELKKEFNIRDLKIIKLTNNIEEVLYETGDEINYNYNYSTRVSLDTKIIIYLKSFSLSSYQILTLNSYFKEIVHLIYIQFILSDLEKSNLKDSLTGLKNRLSFNEEMKVLIPLAIREKMKIGTLLINIDRFRAVNDEHGDEFGDEFLKLYANTIKDTIRSSDIAVRFAGGEFLVLLVNVDSELRTIEIADKLREKLAQTYLITKNGDQFKKSVCIGVSMFPEDSSNIDEVIKKAQDAVSDARDNGRNITKRFESSEGMIDLF